MSTHLHLEEDWSPEKPTHLNEDDGNLCIPCSPRRWCRPMITLLAHTAPLQQTENDCLIFIRILNKNAIKKHLHKRPLPSHISFFSITTYDICSVVPPFELGRIIWTWLTDRKMKDDWQRVEIDEENGQQHSPENNNNKKMHIYIYIWKI